MEAHTNADFKKVDTATEWIKYRFDIKSEVGIGDMSTGLDAKNFDTANTSTRYKLAFALRVPFVSNLRSSISWFKDVLDTQCLQYISTN